MTRPVILVTGASSGIGAATAHRLTTTGAHLLPHGRHPDRLPEITEATGATALNGDLSDPAGVWGLTRQALGAATRIGQKTRCTLFLHGHDPHRPTELPGDLPDPATTQKLTRQAAGRIAEEMRCAPGHLAREATT